MKTIALFLVLSIPMLSFTQTSKKYDQVNYYVNQGYSVYDEYNFSLTEKQEKYVDRTFYPNTDYVVLLVPTDDGVYDSNLYMDYSDGEKFFYDIAGIKPLRGIVFTVSYKYTMTVSMKNYSSYSSYSSYNYSLIILGKS